ncbi:MAG: HAD family hydrolase [candidate division Zixibacteria bacterium]|nr:HAD family hydrolase [candidate division Zixibacteria bacterium]NIR67575.1 HAD family hydrolase [candidate division Zixibacteria bacterium]NIS16142.1 HAD family hydrolase [candidate division Zixibacteria bacterium]NIS48836.1 HAD family hydrolase [candidate division Zixibacteria bacterium]NIT52545.1 HAD family hydrolase [candidate division Zixibacteria bacterium]
MSNEKIKAILIDVGGPLVDDSGIDVYWNDYLVKTLPDLIGRKVPISEIEEANRRSIESYAPSLYSATIWHFVQPDVEKFKKLRGAFDKLNLSRFYRFRSAALEVCRKLSEDHVLAIAANQPASTADYLEEKGLLKYFDFKEMSGSIAHSKPDYRFFLYIAHRLDSPPESCVMVGDRQDNDIVPARKLGMKTVRVMVGSHTEQKVRMPSELPDKTISCISELPDAINDLQS